ncbi:MAG: flagellar brake protein [Chromatiales bacterium]|nr:flagellar brake protein [Gammaproteobacteria bacterium]MBW6476638.1 flagellar brake protein [Chromatiales bacterium]
MNATAPAASRPDPDAHRLEGKNYALALLGRLIQQRVLVTIRIPGSQQSHTSTLLSLDAPSNTLLLDELFPATGRERLSSVGSVQLDAKLEGASLSCQLPLIAVEQVDGLSYYRMGMPESIDYRQRRQGHRVRVDSLAVVAEIYSSEGMAFKGILHDISSLGVSIELKDDQLFSNNALYRCTIYPPHETPFFVRVEICCRRHDAAKGCQILGANFVEMDKRDEHALNRLVNVLDRQLLRSRRGVPDKPTE